MKFYKRFLPKLNQPSDVSILPHVDMGQAIPRIIHQTYFNTTLPEELQENIRTLKELNPAWEYRFYTDADALDFIRKNYDRTVVQYFERINPVYGAARADLFRYLVIYKCGGVYLDIKSTAQRPLDDVIARDDQCILSYWRNKKGEEFEGFGMHPELPVETGELQQWHVIAAPGHPFLKATIDSIIRNIDVYLPSLHGVGQHGVVRVTGPVAYTLAIAPLLRHYGHRIVDGEADLGLRYSIYKKFGHMHIARKGHYTVLKDPVVLLSPARSLASRLVARLQKINDAASGFVKGAA